MNRPTQINPAKSSHFLFTASFVALALLLRLASLQWNSRLYGDVNLFALTARQFAVTNQLDYPMKYEFSDQTSYLSMSSRANQHPPLWPLIAGLVAKTLPTQDTFNILKSLCLVIGMALIFSLWLVKWQLQSSIVFLITIGFVAVSPVLVDFSANGSMYIFSALIILLATQKLSTGRTIGYLHGIPAGFLCATGILIHNSLAFLCLAFIIYYLFPKLFDNQPDEIKHRLYKIFIFLTTLLLCLSPWLYWNQVNFGTLFNSFSSYHLLKRLGLVHTAIYDDVITTRFVAPISISTLISYSNLFIKSAYAFTRQLIWVVSPFGLVLGIIGVYALFRNSRPRSFSIFLPSAFYAIAILAWAHYQFRFLVPILAPFFLLIAYGFEYLHRQSITWKWLARLSLLGVVVCLLVPYTIPFNNLYYGRETPVNAALYDQMLPLARQIDQLPAGTVLGYAESLDGGIETLYWHSQPFVAARSMDESLVRKLIADFNVRYVWVDSTTFTQFINISPTTRSILQSGTFQVLELTSPTKHTCPTFHRLSLR